MRPTPRSSTPCSGSLRTTPTCPTRRSTSFLAALDGDATLAEALDGRYAAPQEQAVDPEPGTEPVGAYLRAITVAGFRGIGPERTLRLRPGPGLTIVAGRNGSGKSSFAEALEVALTGDSSRRRLSASEWAANWTNLHSARPRMIRVELAEDDVGTTTVGVDWPVDGTAFADRRTWVQRPGRRREDDVAVLGWTRALRDCSPLLPHEELGRLLTAPPNELYNKLESILGLGRFADAQDRLNAAHKAAAEPDKQMRAELTALKKALAASGDERAASARSHLSRRPPRRDALRALATGSDPVGGAMAGLVALAETPHRTGRRSRPPSRRSARRSPPCPRARVTRWISRSGDPGSCARRWTCMPRMATGRARCVGRQSWTRPGEPAPSGSWPTTAPIGSSHHAPWWPTAGPR